MNRDARLRNFRLRLLAAFGVGMVPGLFYAPLVSGAPENQTECYTLEQGETCLPLAMNDAILERLGLVTGAECGGYQVDNQIVDATMPGTCCYGLSIQDPCYDIDSEVDCGCYGRPYVAEAEIIAAPVVDNPGWGPNAAPELVPNLDGLSAEQRSALAEFWSDNARAEHSSVAGFHRLCLELMAHGAPLELLERSQRAAHDELVHARVCYALASHYAGRPLGPGPMPIGPSAPIAASLVELAVATAREGCLAETSAAWLANELAASATDPAVRAALEQIAFDEAEHAELSWMTLRWALEVGGEEVRDAVAEVFTAARPHDFGGSRLTVAGHGLLANAEVQAIVARGFQEILTPMIRSLRSFPSSRAA